MVQLVNSTCVICRERISSALEAKHCDKCGNPVHINCLNDYVSSDRNVDCQLCGGDPACASARPTAAIKPAEFTIPGFAVLVVCISVGALIGNFVAGGGSLGTGLGGGVGGGIGSAIARGIWGK